MLTGKVTSFKKFFIPTGLFICYLVVRTIKEMNEPCTNSGLEAIGCTVGVQILPIITTIVGTIIIINSLVWFYVAKKKGLNYFKAYIFLCISLATEYAIAYLTLKK